MGLCFLLRLRCCARSYGVSDGWWGCDLEAHLKTVTDEYLREVRERLNAATNGPWRSFIEGRDHASGSGFIMTSGEDIELMGATPADQDFIAAVRQDVGILLDEVAHLRSISAK